MGFRRDLLEALLPLAALGTSSASVPPEHPRAIFVLRNNDIGDLLVMHFSSSPYGVTNAGMGWVVFGRTNFVAMSLAAAMAPSDGFRIIGESSSDFAGTRITPAGDINGDGLPDVVSGNKKGLSVFLHQAKKVSKAEWEKAQPQPLAK